MPPSRSRVPPGFLRLILWKSHPRDPQENPQTVSHFAGLRVESGRGWQDPNRVWAAVRSHIFFGSSEPANSAGQNIPARAGNQNRVKETVPMKRLIPTRIQIAALTATLSLSPLIQAETVGFYVGIDSRNPLASGIYAGRQNPNFNRLTWLYAHTYEYVPDLAPAGATTFAVNHYHPIGAYSLSGPTNAVVTIPSNANNRIPEISTRQPPLTLAPTTNALYAGKLVHARSEENFSDLRVRATDDLNQPGRYGPGSPEWILFYSSAGTRTNSLAGGIISLELVAKTEGLHIGTAEILDVLSSPGDRFSLGAGPAINFAPMFWVEGNAPTGTYSASFKLVDTNTEGGRTPFLESGTFHLDFKVAPQPTLAIASSVNLTLPLVTAGYVLEGAPSHDGPWTRVAFSPGTQSGDRQTVTVPTGSATQVFRLRKP